MTTSVTEGLTKVQGAVRSAVSNKKISDLARDTGDVHEKTKFTSDHGVPISNTDHWLKVVSDDRGGPSVLEDQFAREKVRLSLSYPNINY